MRPPVTSPNPSRNPIHTLLPAVGLMLLAGAVPAARGADPALTIYNQNFAVVRDTVELNLQPGANDVSFTGATAHLEPDSVILRDPTGRHALRILEQNYRNDPVSQELLLSLYEGKTIDFRVVEHDQPPRIVRGKIIRSGYVPHYEAMSRYGSQYANVQRVRANATAQPIIEMDGQLTFGLPGKPIFPALDDEAILEPTLHWVLQTDEAARFDAQIAYVTGAMSWNADYNLIAPEKGNRLDLVGWVTMDNQTGKTFTDATIKLMAGDVSKIQPEESRSYSSKRLGYAAAEMEMAPPVSEKTFDEYHLYTLNRKTTLRDRQTKQVEFVRAEGVESEHLYVYDGAAIDTRRYRGRNAEAIRGDKNYGTRSNPKVWVMREFKNTEANKLGLPLPRGRLRFYRRDDDGQLEFVGENVIDHTPRDETVRVYTGNAFDLVGERRRTNYQVDSRRDTLDESFEIKVRNHKKEPVEVRVVEHLYRWVNWEIRDASNAHTKTDSQTAEFRVKIPPDGEQTITYTAHYWW